MELHLFDGTLNNIISEVVSLSVKFLSSECIILTFILLHLILVVLRY